MMDYMNDGGWLNGFGVVFMVLVWGGLIALGVWAMARKSTGTQVAATSALSPRQILDRRFAAGELDTEEYAAARLVLEGCSIEDAAPRS